MPLGGSPEENMIFARGDWFYILMTLVVTAAMSRPSLHAAQLENYSPAAVFRSKKVRSAYLTDLVCILVFAGIWTGFYFVSSRAFWGFLSCLFFFIAEFALYFIEDGTGMKKPLRYTRRAVRAIVLTSLAITALVTVGLTLINGASPDHYLRYPLFFALPAVYPALFAGALAVLNVFERLNNLRYERRAARRLAARPDLIKIAVTGSCGKTSVKNYLAAMLAADFDVLATEGSFNTPLGISKTVDRLTPATEVFIAEMGARKKGDIARLMRMVRPTHAILTAINSQHLGTFGSREAIIREKTRVLGVYGDEGVCVVSGALKDIPEIRRNERGNIVLAGEDEECAVRVTDVAVCEDGSVFRLSVGRESAECATRLLGEHNIADIAMAAAMAYCLGVSLERIAGAIGALKPVEHRLQLIGGEGIRIIDDTFNCNPDGAACALGVLALFHGRKVAVTPGMVELGEEEESENRLLGRRLAEVCDAVVLIGKKRTAAIAAGLREGGFGGEAYVFGSLAEAKKNFPRLLHLGDTVLLLNDLPDNYDE